MSNGLDASETKSSSFRYNKEIRMGDLSNGLVAIWKFIIMFVVMNNEELCKTEFISIVDYPQCNPSCTTFLPHWIFTITIISSFVSIVWLCMRNHQLVARWMMMSMRGSSCLSFGSWQHCTSKSRFYLLLKCKVFMLPLSFMDLIFPGL